VRGIRIESLNSPVALWGVELSPFALKLAAMLEWAGIRYRWLPRQGRRFENIVAAFRIALAKRRGRVLRHGGNRPLDEFPQVPFLITPDQNVHYDSSALADWIDDEHPAECGALLPRDPVLNFLARFIDEAFDEFGLYMVHHNRWVLAAADNDAGRRLAAEFSNFLPPGGARSLARRFPERQVRRLPYLFSVATAGFQTDLPDALTPPARRGFPGTHALLDAAWHQHLAAMESLLERQPYLLGARFSLADASAYGQLSMNLTDAGAVVVLAERAPRTHGWLRSIRDGAHRNVRGELEATEALRPLLEVISETFVPLMRQNERAYEAALARGETLFNEAAFDRGRALYDGELQGQAFRHVVKTFQVRSWRDLRSCWTALTSDECRALDSRLPGLEEAFAPKPI
jgi:glutathione S-transferase